MTLMPAGIIAAEMVLITNSRTGIMYF